MGCVYTKRQKPTKDDRNGGTKPTTYSWDNKPKVNPKDFMFENLNNETVGRLPGTVNGEQFIIQNCQNCNIYIFDHINTINVDDCTGCSVFLGPVKGSIFLRDCQDCRFVSACQQFRARDCKRIDMFLFCATEPCIENCSDMRFGCFCYHYSELESQFRSAGLTVFNNRWNEVHDFTPVEGEQTWKLLPQDARVDDFLPVPTTDSLTQVQTCTDPMTSVVPQTTQQKIAQQSCLVVFFPDGQAHQRAMSFIQEMERTANVLVQTTEMTIDEMEAQKIFNTDSYNNVVKRGPVISLEYNGEDCNRACQDTAKAIATETGSTGLVYVSCSPVAAAQQINKLFNFK